MKCPKCDHDVGWVIGEECLISGDIFECPYCHIKLLFTENEQGIGISSGVEILDDNR